MSDTTPIIFLDIDGVLNSINWDRDHGRNTPVLRLDPMTVARLSDLCRAAGADIVIASSWRQQWSAEEIGGFLKQRGLDPRITIRGATPDLTTRHGAMLIGADRADEVAAWRRANNHTGPFCLLDDARSATSRQVLTDAVVGLTDDDCERAQAILTPKSEQ